MKQQYLRLVESIQEGDKEEAVVESLKLVESGIKVAEIFTECIEPILTDIGEKFARLEIFLPELMLASEAVKAIQAELDPILKASANNAKQKHNAVIATVYGDVHDIGKNIVGLMLEVNGFNVSDLGVDVPTNDILKAAEDFNAELICLSGLMIPSFPYMKDTIDRVKGNDKYSNRFKILVGGGPVTKEWAMEVGADGYADDAVGAVQEAFRVLQEK